VGVGEGQDLTVWAKLKTLVNVEREGREGQCILHEPSQKKNARGAFCARRQNAAAIAVVI
jgi:hypothetical protein